MKIKIEQFLFGGTLWSWATVGQNIGRALIKSGHDVHFVSTDGVQDKYVPSDLKDHIKQRSEGPYDMQISYTAMHNFVRYLAAGSKNRLGIWNYDGTVIPKHMIKYHSACDKLLPSSNFSKEIFIKNGVPESKIEVVPHGIDLEEFKTNKKYKLKTHKKIKIFFNIATPHLRKNIRRTLRTFGKAFNKKDDVCLVMKVNPKQIKQRFDVDFYDELKIFKNKFKNHAEIEVIKGFVPSLAELYNACDIVFMMSNLECWWLPGTEALACNKLVIASNWGGQLHYLSPENSLLIDGKVISMPPHYQYWEASHMGEMFEPNIDDAVSKLRYAVDNYDKLIEQFSPSMKATVEKYNWDNVVKKILSINNV